MERIKKREERAIESIDLDLDLLLTFFFPSLVFSLFFTRFFTHRRPPHTETSSTVVKDNREKKCGGE